MTEPSDTSKQLPTPAGEGSFSFERPSVSNVASRWELASEAIATALRQQLVLAFLGSASSGKDSAIRELFGLDFGQVDPIPGSTETVRAAALDASENVIVVNAPGFGDIRSDVDRSARSIIDQVDIAIYLLNADGGATIDERKDLDRIRQGGRPVLVCINKIDLIRESEREMFVEATVGQLGVSRKDVVLTAFDPMPALSPEPIGVDAVIRWIHKRLSEDGKDLLFAKHLRNRNQACQAVIRTAAQRSALAGAVPIAGVDITAVTALQVKLIGDIAAIYDRKMDNDLALFILGEALAGTSKGFIRWAMTALKGAGWIPGAQLAHLATSALGATIAGATTFGVGRAAVVYMEKGVEVTPEDLRVAFDVGATAWRDEHRGTSR